jgi:hypothetical protein
MRVNHGAENLGQSLEQQFKSNINYCSRIIALSADIVFARNICL